MEVIRNCINLSFFVDPMMVYICFIFETLQLSMCTVHCWKIKKTCYNWVWTLYNATHRYCQRDVIWYVKVWTLELWFTTKKWKFTQLFKIFLIISKNLSSEKLLTQHLRHPLVSSILLSDFCQTFVPIYWTICQKKNLVGQKLCCEVNFSSLLSDKFSRIIMVI